MRKYSEEHQWMEIAADGTAIVGITKYAADELGEITFIELPEAGRQLKAGDQLCVIESVKAASDVFMPVAGTVVASNHAVEDQPAILNSDPENAGWICRIKDFSAAEADKLMDAEQYRQFCK